jgi:hypothetical protein
MKKLISYFFFLVVELIVPRSTASYNGSFTGKLQKLKKSNFKTSPPTHNGPQGNKKIGFVFARKK